MIEKIYLKSNRFKSVQDNQNRTSHTAECMSRLSVLVQWMKKKCSRKILSRI